MNRLKTGLLLVLMTLLIMFVGQLIGGRQGMLFALILAALMNMGAYWFSDRIVLSMYGARQVSPHEAPELYSIIEELVRRANLPMPKVYIINTDTPNAFATGRNPAHAAVAVTTGILRMLDRRELTGVLAHELGHVQNRDILLSSVVATLAGAIAYLANMAQWAMIFGGGNDDEGEGAGSLIASLLVIIFAPLAATLIQLAISRSREYLADETSANITGDPLGLASALQKIDYYAKALPMRGVNPATSHMFIINPLYGEGLMSLFSTHPSTAQRIERLRAIAARK